MDTKVPDGPNAQFRSGDVARTAFLDASTADLAANAADVTLLIDHRGIVRDAAFPGDEFDPGEYEGWIGRNWVDLVAEDSKAKVAALINAPGGPEARRWRHVNHLTQAGDPDLPLRFFTLSTGQDGWLLAIGRDMRGASRMQQRLLEAQNSMEREYARVREAETRFRLLFQVASEAVVIIADGSLKITDANPAASRILGRAPKALDGASLDAAFGAAAAAAVRDTLLVAGRTGRPEALDLRPEGAKQDCHLVASVYRQGRDTYFLVRVAPADAEAFPDEPDTSMSRLAEILPDGLVLTGEDGRIHSVNEGFVDIAQLHGAEEAVGQTIDQFLGRTEVEFNVLLANLREHGVIRHFATTLRSRLDIQEPVEVSAVSAPGPVGRVFGFSIRPVGRRIVASRGSEGALPSTVEQLSDLVGRVALKDIVRESTDMIERSCIEAALELTNDNRASAAEILGLSRQSLYAKMHRHKIGSLQGKSDH